MGASSSASLVQYNGLPFSDGTHLDILKEEMTRRYISRSDIPSRFSSHTVRGHGRARCDLCSRKWTSHQASAKVDLKNLTVRVWKQKCQNCHNIVQMTFKEEEFRRMVNNMLDRLERQMKGEHLDNHDDANSGGHGPPHRKELCEGCDWGDGDCRGNADGRSFENQHLATGHAGGGTTGSGRSSGSGNSNGDDSRGGLKVLGGIAVGAGLLALGALAVSAFSDSREEEQKRRGGKK